MEVTTVVVMVKMALSEELDGKGKGKIMQVTTVVVMVIMALPEELAGIVVGVEV